MRTPRLDFPRIWRLAWSALTAVLLVAAGPGTRPDLFARFDLPDAWEATFWNNPDAHALLKLEPKALAALVPVQAGLRFCRCPSCDASELDDPLSWSIRKPEVVTCKRCEGSFPSDKYPAKDEKDKKVPEEAVEVAPGRTHKYPYHAVAAEHQRYDGERLYLEARRDYEAREYLSKAALYAAVRYREQPSGQKDPNLARVAALLVLRFAQVYPDYAQHLDQPGQPKFFQPARQPPPYRRGYATAKWDWSGSLDVPLNLVIAHALIRDDPALDWAGKLLNDPDPARTIEHDLLRASAAFVRAQPVEDDEPSLQVVRGLLAVGRLLNDAGMVRDATARLGRFSERGFTHDGLWRSGDGPTHRRILGMLDGWVDRLMAGVPPAPAADRLLEGRSTPGASPMLALARSAGSAILADSIPSDIQLASWPATRASAASRLPALLGGAGLARLAVGEGDNALDLELRGMGQFGSHRSRRQALRLAVGGRVVLGDLDDLPPRPDGWDLASTSHNTVVVDGLNQRETLRMMREPVDGGQFLFHAADPDFQVAVLDDPRAYPRTTAAGGYRQTVVACSGPKARYAVAVFEVRGGSRHDQVFHAPAGRWLASIPTAPGPDSLLPASIPHVESARPEDGRWFVQGFGEFGRLAQGVATRPVVVELHDPGKPAVRLHVLGDMPAEVITGSTPRKPKPDEPSRPALIIRRQTQDGSDLSTNFVTVFEPIGAGGPPIKVGRMTATPGFVVLYLETADGPEHLVINLRPGSARKVELADGRTLETDGRVVRARREELILAGGTFASDGTFAVSQGSISGKVLASARFPAEGSRGWFETDEVIAQDRAQAGRTLIVRHGDGTSRAWTLLRVERPTNKRTRLIVREEPGFLIEGEDRHARYYQFPGTTHPGPHTFHLSTIAR